MSDTRLSREEVSTLTVVVSGTYCCSTIVVITETTKTSFSSGKIADKEPSKGMPDDTYEPPVVTILI